MKTLETNFYPVNKLSNYRLYNTIPESDYHECYKIVEGVKLVDLNKCTTWLKKD